MTKENYCPLMYHSFNVERCMLHDIPCPFYQRDKNQCEDKRNIEIQIALERDFQRGLRELEEDLE